MTLAIAPRELLRETRWRESTNMDAAPAARKLKLTRTGAPEKMLQVNRKENTIVMPQSENHLELVRKNSRRVARRTTDALRWRNRESLADSWKGRKELLAGLTAPQAWIASKYFYDALGSQLFDAITRLPEYYPTRTEAAILARHVNDIARV